MPIKPMPPEMATVAPVAAATETEHDQVARRLFAIPDTEGKGRGLRHQ
ncbi:hypothetical protein C7374_12112 [Falsochrobactrum ovis]|uniref:Uncharacterized protein n=1 Tax=Falsochrobactrum ovis TaxID=1293442 RepID=A0A364JSB4_9HYPH|nr:hypothetical protein C7374_12112 [Falsochrobactrum ovis]